MWHFCKYKLSTQSCGQQPLNIELPSENFRLASQNSGLAYGKTEVPDSRTENQYLRFKNQYINAIYILIIYIFNYINNVSLEM
ncbi:MAG: hypothetical protein LBT50_01630 [Prevotellaceae bacterium]|jgi:hypothetical protein|nr:hypothetical protein [Prevotellaceae bacterium]